MASHGGTNLQAIMNACDEGVLNAEIKLVISNNSESKALSRAKAGDIPALHFSSFTNPDFGDLDRALKNEFTSRAVEYIILAGYMRKVGPILLRAFSGKVLNSHPSLLPKYGGRGMYGDRVHEEVIKNGETETGVTIHIVDGGYDSGIVISQEKVAVLEGDSVEDLRRRVQEVEHRLWVKVLRDICES